MSRRFPGTAWELTAGPPDLLRDWYGGLTPFDRAIAYGLFACTSEKDPAAWQEVQIGDLLDIIEVAHHVSPTGAEVHHGQHYRDGIAALLRLFNVAVPVRKVTCRREGRRTVKEKSFGYVRLLQGLQLVYRDGAGDVLDLDEPGYTDYRVDINRSRDTDNRGRRDRETKGGQAPVFALARVDSSGGVVRDNSGEPLRRLPVAYRFRWGSDIVEDLIDSGGKGNGRGWLRINRRVFDVLRSLRAGNNTTAMRLLELVISDIIADGPTKQILVKPAKLVLRALGFRESGSGDSSKRDGRWTKNVRRVAEAVGALKELGVLQPESGENPRLHDDGRYMYDWIRSEEWTFTSGIDIGVAASDIVLPRGPDLAGSDIREARKAAGLTLKQFAKQFGRTVSFWSRVENGRRQVPTAAVPMVAMFVMRHHPDWSRRGKVDADATRVGSICYTRSARGVGSTQTEPIAEQALMSSDEQKLTSKNSH